ncbi:MULTISPECIES: tetratricopeptide repeat protein [unclassified Marinomonas]|uniref:tetratricopeptide repeat protein n=1 Tax=unclassified Marinomonas TaxID=196814 RepID=UPI000C2905F6|nr:tetratricopeptide repeat protein [Marinomonas sp. ef1]
MKSFITASLLTLGLVSSTWAAGTSSLLEIQQRWAQINYQMEDDAKEAAFNDLAIKAQELVNAEPNNPDDLIWLGIIQSSTAGAKGGLGALSLAKAAKKSFEDAITINPSALSGSAMTSLGVLYHKVPGWPIGFGSDKKAKELLVQSYKLNPTSIDSNYFLAEFLYDDGDYEGAKQHLEKAQKAAPRPTRPIADIGRHKEVDTLMEKVNQKL